MPLGPLRSSPRTITLAAAAAGVAPTRIRVEPFMPGNVVMAAGPVNGLLVGACLNKVAGKYASFRVAAADVTSAANVIGQTAAAREADGDVSGDLTITFGNAVDDIIGEIVDCADVADADLNLTTVVMVNGVPYHRINDAAAPNPGVGAWGSDSDNGFTLVIGASTGADVIKVGTEIEVYIVAAADVGKCAEKDATGTYIAGTAMAASIPEERFLGLIASSIDSAGRTVVQLKGVDVVMAEAAIISLTTVTK